MANASFSGKWPPQKAQGEGIAWERAETFIPIQAWNWKETIVGVTSGLVTIDPSATLGPATSTIATSGLIVLRSATSGDAFDFCWSIPGNMDCTGDTLVQVVYALGGTAAQNVSASGLTHLTLSYRRAGFGSYTSGLAFTATQSADQNWAEQSWVDSIPASGLGALVATDCALLSGYVSGDATKGTKFKNYDLVTFRVTNRLAAGTTGLPVEFVGARIWWPRKLV